MQQVKDLSAARPALVWPDLHRLKVGCPLSAPSPTDVIEHTAGKSKHKHIATQQNELKRKIHQKNASKQSKRNPKQYKTNKRKILCST
eukprot:scaffold316773_cov47-Prasinocladus_malaysianus.AAC.2